ncbi:iron ABC transporter permease [Hyphomicrobium sp. LHD-15]|uniref:FecCD family ABC transporter permease n=1 Tax=Hyphomicrobium sp. LHD-15 TaxID=3072142 RepID=UPI00280ED903|nr:iron ABC transporter permease [Hyphomicrobium sp. LHD-15]MDQ8700612.1 iron ABC transporter permease [Hyphomicrobium sp. LHD-15]
MRVWITLGGFVFLALTVGICAGHTWEGPDAVFRALAGDTSMESALLLEWRVPRVLAAALVGALLGLGGAIFQGVFRNPLAEPYLLGSAGGAALGATVALLVPLSLSQTFSLPILAFAGAWGATLLVIGVARAAGTMDVSTLLLSGVAVSAVLAAFKSFLMLALSDETVSLQVVLSWVLGGMQTPTWAGVGGLAAVSLAALLGCLALAPGLDKLGLGEAMASTFGMNVDRFIGVAVLVGAATVAISVTVGGLIGFVGLAAPHIARWRLGPLHRSVIPASALIGAAIVTLADAIARSALPPAEIPLGLVTAVAGGPFFLFLLARSRQW